MVHAQLRDGRQPEVGQGHGVRLRPGVLPLVDGEAAVPGQVHPPLLQQGQEGPPGDGVHGRQVVGGTVQPSQTCQRASTSFPSEHLTNLIFEKSFRSTG